MGEYRLLVERATIDQHAVEGTCGPGNRSRFLRISRRIFGRWCRHAQIIAAGRRRLTHEVSFRTFSQERTDFRQDRKLFERWRGTIDQRHGLQGRILPGTDQRRLRRTAIIRIGGRSRHEVRRGRSHHHARCDLPFRRNTRRARALRNIGRHQIGHVVTVKRGTAGILHPHIRRTRRLHVEKIGRLAGNVDQAAFVERSAIVDAHQNRRAIFRVGDARIARQGKCRMCGRKMFFIVHFTIRRQATVEGGTVPGGKTGLVITRLFFRKITTALDGIGITDQLAPAALGNALAIGNARAGFDAIFRFREIFLAALGLRLGLGRGGTRRCRSAKHGNCKPLRTRSGADAEFLDRRIQIVCPTLLLARRTAPSLASMICPCHRST